ncbi:MAG TPA: aldo/keto reductase [Chloroflexota bacterium]|jgi:aryl-alcohol dehydrogenase-like predicted oxidoreductase
MNYRPLGRSGLTVSEIGFGCGPTAGLMVHGSTAEREAAVAHALALGITYFDTAPIYGDHESERHLGETLRALSAHPIVATKVVLELEDLTDVAGAVRRSVEGSLARLERERLDVLQLHNRVAAQRAHRPNTGVGALLSVDDVLGPGGVLASMQRLRAEGLVGALGCCAFGGEMPAVRALLDTSAFDVLLAHCSLLNPSAAAPAYDVVGQDYARIMQHAAAHGVGVAAIRALEAGALADPPRPELPTPHGTPPAAAGSTPPEQALDAAARAPSEPPPIARRLAPGYAASTARAAALHAPLRARGWDSLTEVAIRYVLAEPAVSTVVLGFSSVAHVEQAVTATARGALSEYERAWLDGLLRA